MYIGQVFNEKYEILSLIGKGGMSEVYLAMDISKNKQWAVKELKFDKNHTEIQNYMRIEAKLISDLEHPSIPRIEEIIETEDSLVIIMEYIWGDTLGEIIDKFGVLPEQYVIDLAMQIIDVLKYIHSKNIIYRDLKPQNIVVKPDGKIMLIDFGIAIRYLPEKMNDIQCLGTKGYAAPEQYMAKGLIDFRVDIYAFGVMLGYMLSGINPVSNEYNIFSVMRKNTDFSDGLKKIILKCTQEDPNERYQNFDEIKTAFECPQTCGEPSKWSRFIEWLFNVRNYRCYDIDRRVVDKKNNTESPLFCNGYPIHAYSTKDETTILSEDVTDYLVPPSVLEEQKTRIFLSYCHSDSDLADMLCDKLDSYKHIKISRYTTNVPYKSSFREFMQSLKEHDKVIMIISDKYLKSRACMYEVGQLINTYDFKDKILFIVCSENDKKYYKTLPLDAIEAKIYDPHERNQYIIFWETQCKILKDDLEKIEDECAKIETLEVIRDIKHIISSDIGAFMKYIADVRGVSFDTLYQHDFNEFLKELGL